MPFTTKFFPQAENPKLFVCGPFVSAHTRIDHVDPTLTALARLSMITTRSDSLVELLGNSSPLLGLLAHDVITS